MATKANGPVPYLHPARDSTSKDNVSSIRKEEKKVKRASEQKKEEEVKRVIEGVEKLSVGPAARENESKK